MHHFEMTFAFVVVGELCTQVCWWPYLFEQLVS